jgi:peptidoglycan-associated lipoprotein
MATLVDARRTRRQGVAKMILSSPRRRCAPNLALITAAALALGACASHPKPAPSLARSSRPSMAPTPAAPTPPPEAVEGAPLPGSARDFVVNVGDRVYFDLNDFHLRPDAQPVLAAQAGWLARYPNVRVRIEGNCDERGTREYNFALGARRANSVQEFLVDHGVAPARITTVSYGKERPIDPGTGEASWAHNRNARTDIVSGAAG